MFSDRQLLYFEEGNGFVAISWEPYLQKWIIHMDCKKWSLSHYKRYKKIWKIITSKLKARGITEIYGLCDGPKEVKFNKLFGVKSTGDLAEIDNGKEYNYIVRGEL